jgi:hypothetical protein
VAALSLRQLGLHRRNSVTGCGPLGLSVEQRRLQVGQLRLGSGAGSHQRLDLGVAASEIARAGLQLAVGAVQLALHGAISAAKATTDDHPPQ